MSIIYITEPETKISVEENRLIAKEENGMLKSVPIQSVEGITFLTRPHISGYAMEQCLILGIPVSFMSKGGRYFGRLLSSGHVSAELQRKQAALYDTDFALNLSKQIIYAKTKNQLVVLKRYAKNKEIDISEIRQKMSILIAKISGAKAVDELMGYEGGCAKLYFSGMSKCIDDEFYFSGRSRRPPRDPFNSLISLGYSILMNQIYNEIENRGLNPYFGFMHRDFEKHPTLASDMLEEWRAVIVDSMAMSLLNGHELNKNHFFFGNGENPPVYLTKEGMKIFLKKLEKKLQTKAKYLLNVDYSVTFRRAISLQLKELAKAITEGDASLYVPLVVR